jgi:gentisate 1,2-dioxygenase
MTKLSFTASLKSLCDDATLFRTFLTHGSLAVELYKPHNVNLQKPHERDEIYVIVSGKLNFTLGSEDYDVIAGDVLFVAAGVAHRFSNFSENFVTWVFFTDLSVARVDESPARRATLERQLQRRRGETPMNRLTCFAIGQLPSDKRMQ